MRFPGQMEAERHAGAHGERRAHARVSRVVGVGASLAIGTVTGLIVSPVLSARQADRDRVAPSGREIEGRLGTQDDAAPRRGAAESFPSSTDRAIEARASHKRQHDLGLARHAGESVVADWAVRIRAALVGDLTQIASAAELRIVDVDCRTKSCVATLEWPSYPVAVAKWNSVLSHPYSVRCAIDVFLDPPADEHARYPTSVLFDCAEAQQPSNR